MDKIPEENYAGYTHFIDAGSCGAIYPFSIAGRYQPGDIYSDGSSVLFWHYCGFAFAYGECGDDLLGWIYDEFLSPESTPARRFVFFGNSGKTAAYFNNRKDLVSEMRYFYEYPAGKTPEAPVLPDGFTIREIDERLFAGLEGNVTPRFSWDNAEDFLKYGKGYCISDGDTPAAWSVAAAVSAEEIDIGIETAPEYRRRGLAAAAARLMIRRCLGSGKRPVWACNAANTGSRRTAESIGFVKTSECMIYRQCPAGS